MKDSFNPEYLKQKYPNHDINFKEDTNAVGSGKFGSVHKAQLSVEKKRDENKNGIFRDMFNKIFSKKSKFYREHNFIVKKYDSRYNVTLALNTYKFLKSNNVPTFKTYRKYNDYSIIMDDLSLNNKFCVSLMRGNQNENNSDHNYLTNNKILILNLEEVVIKVIEILNMFEKLKLNSKIGEYNVIDYLFFIGDKNTKTNIDVIVGDFDSLRVNPSDYICGDEKDIQILLYCLKFISNYGKSELTTLNANLVKKYIEKHKPDFNKEIFKKYKMD